MRQRFASETDDSKLGRLCRTAERRSAALGHLLGPWKAEEDVARRAICTKCGRAVYARAEGSLAGIAGRACGEPCDA